MHRRRPGSWYHRHDDGSESVPAPGSYAVISLSSSVSWRARDRLAMVARAGRSSSAGREPGAARRSLPPRSGGCAASTTRRWRRRDTKPPGIVFLSDSCLGLAIPPARPAADQQRAAGYNCRLAGTAGWSSYQGVRQCGDLPLRWRSSPSTSRLEWPLAGAEPQDAEMGKLLATGCCWIGFRLAVGTRPALDVARRRSAHAARAAAAVRPPAACSSRGAKGSAPGAHHGKSGHVRGAERIPASDAVAHQALDATGNTSRPCDVGAEKRSVAAESTLATSASLFRSDSTSTSAPSGAAALRACSSCASSATRRAVETASWTALSP